MKLYLFRHADAATQAIHDDDRAISKKGAKQCERVANFCRCQNIRPDVILASPLLRAQQTAKPISNKLDVSIETVPWLVYETATEKVLEHLAARTEPSSIMIVGHEPDFSLLAATLLGAESTAIRVRKASLLLIEVTGFRKGGGRLEWSLPAKMM